MLRYIPAILLIQVVTAVLLWVNQGAAPRDLAVQFGLPAVLIALVAALWFASIGRRDAERATAKMQLAHAREKEKLNLNAEKSKAEVLVQTQKEIRKQEKRVGRMASFKVTLAFVGAGLMGVLMLITELVTFGLMTLTTTLGGLGGYLVRARQSYDAKNDASVLSDAEFDTDDELKELPPPPKSLPSEIQ